MTSFDRLLNWLHADREEAAQKYELLRRRLIHYFTNHSCAAAEDLTDKVLDCVVQQLDRQPVLWSDKPLPYIFGIARNVYRHHVGQQFRFNNEIELYRLPDPRQPEDIAEKERRSRCLHQCLQELKPEDRQLLLRYYVKATLAKAEHHKDMAAQLGCTLNALRLKIMRLREQLRACITACLQQG